MASRSPPLHSSQNRRTSSRGVSLISETLLARSLLDRSRLFLDRRLLLDRPLRLLGRSSLLRDRHLLRRPSRSGGGKSAVGRVSTARTRVGFRRRLRLLRLLRRRLLLRRGGFLLGARLLRWQRRGVGDAEAQPQGELIVVLDAGGTNADHPLGRATAHRELADVGPGEGVVVERRVDA